MNLGEETLDQVEPGAVADHRFEKARLLHRCYSAAEKS
jgi:hypothetical protein